MKQRECQSCGTMMRPRRGQKFCSDKCRYEFWARTNRPYKSNDDEIVTRCFYCGLPSNTIDHIPPVTARERLEALGLGHKYPYIELDACRECNSWLGSRTLWTKDSRKKFIKKVIAKKYRKYLALPDWDDDDLSELGPVMHEYIVKSKIVRDITIQRLAW